MRRRLMSIGIGAVIAAGSVVLPTAAVQVAEAAACPEHTVVIVAHPDDGIAFMHDNIRWQRVIGNCVHIISLTSHYNTGGTLNGREEGARDAYQKVNDAAAPDDTAQHYDTTVRQRFGAFWYYTYYIHNDNAITLSFLRQPASTYPGLTVGSIYSRRGEPGLIDSLRQALEFYRPQRVYTLNTAGVLSTASVNCPVQNAEMIAADECDHYDHVGTAILAKAALQASNVPAPLYEFHGYDMARGKWVNMNITSAACTLFCAIRDAYVAKDGAAAATPWGALLSSPDMYTNTMTNAGGPVRRILAQNVETTFTYLGCTFKVMHGQYGPSAYAQLKRSTTNSSCATFTSKVFTTNGLTTTSTKTNPVNGTAYQAAVTATEESAQFTIRATAYGLVCELSISPHSNGTSDWKIKYISGYGVCPAVP